MGNPINKLKANIGPLHDFDFIPIWDPTVGEEERITVSKLRDHILSGISSTSTDYYVTGATMNGDVLELSRNGLSDVSVDLSQFNDSANDTYVTGFTYNENNVLTLSRNQGLPNLTILLNVMSGLTVNGQTTTDTLQFNTLYTGNTIVEGMGYWDEDNGTVSIGLHNNEVFLQVGQETHYYIKNQSGATLENGRVIRAAGTLGASGKILGEYMIADGTIPPKYTLGICTADILNGDDGYVTDFGLVRGIDTTGTPYGETWNDGDVLWVSSTVQGGLTNVHPTTPSSLHIEMAMVIHASANGSIFVRPHRYPHFHDLQEAAWTGGSESNLDIIQWNSSNSNFELTNTPNLVSIDALTILSGGTNLIHLFSETDYYVTGATLDGNTLELSRNGGLSDVTVDLSQLTGSTTVPSLSALTDVNITSPQDGDTLTHVGGSWVNLSKVNQYFTPSSDGQTYFTSQLVSQPVLPEKSEMWVNGQKQRYGLAYDFVLSGGTNQDVVWLSSNFDLNTTDELNIKYQ